MSTRREFLLGLGGILLSGMAPAIIRPGVLMPVRGDKVYWGVDWGTRDSNTILTAVRTIRIPVAVTPVLARWSDAAEKITWDRPVFSFIEVKILPGEDATEAINRYRKTRGEEGRIL